MEKLEVTYEDTPAMLERMKRAALYRGLIINKFSDVEFCIDMVVSNYFCDDEKRRSELRHSLISNSLFVSFNAKRIVLEFLIEEHFHEIQKKYPSLFNDLEDLMKIRNVVAHFKVFTKEKDINDFDGDNVYFENFETKKRKMVMKTLHVNSEQMKKLNVVFSKTIIALNDLNSMINKSSS